MIVHLHSSIPTEIKLLTKKIEKDKTLLQGLISVLSQNKEVYELLVIDEEIKPGFLIISDKIELRTTNLLGSTITKNTELTIIPISHGG
jgi:hypothetical protein